MTVQVHCGESAEVLIELYDLAGNRVTGGTFTGRSAGSTGLTIPLNGVAAGIYCCRITTGTLSTTKMITVIR